MSSAAVDMLAIVMLFGALMVALWVCWQVLRMVAGAVLAIARAIRRLFPYRRHGYTRFHAHGVYGSPELRGPSEREIKRARLKVLR